MRNPLVNRCKSVNCGQFPWVRPRILAVYAILNPLPPGEGGPKGRVRARSRSGRRVRERALTRRGAAPSPGGRGWGKAALRRGDARIRGRTPEKRHDRPDRKNDPIFPKHEGRREPKKHYDIQLDQSGNSLHNAAAFAYAPSIVLSGLGQSSLAWRLGGRRFSPGSAWDQRHGWRGRVPTPETAQFCPETAAPRRGTGAIRWSQAPFMEESRRDATLSHTVMCLNGA